MNKNVQSTQLYCKNIVLLIHPRRDISIFYWSHVFTWCEFTGKISPNLDFAMQRNAKLSARACACWRMNGSQWKENCSVISVCCYAVVRVFWVVVNDHKHTIFVLQSSITNFVKPMTSCLLVSLFYVEKLRSRYLVFVVSSVLNFP